jgi:hypothetical protein
LVKDEKGTHLFFSEGDPFGFGSIEDGEGFFAFVSGEAVQCGAIVLFVVDLIDLFGFEFWIHSVVVLIGLS